MNQVDGLLAELALYRSARQRLLRTCGLAESQRDPLAEFAEQFAAGLTSGTLAPNRVQKGWDIEQHDGGRVQVRYLANPQRDRGAWVNEHTVDRIADVHWYMLVLFEDLRVVGALAFPEDLSDICARLGKRHPRQYETLQLTRRNWESIRDAPATFARLGMRIWLPPDWEPVGDTVG